MKSTTKNIYIYVHILLICLFNLAFAQEKIKILVEKPNTITVSNHTAKYNNIGKTVQEKFKSYELKFDYEIDTEIEKPTSYEEYYKNLAKAIKDSTYDMMIISGNTLFADDSDIESGYVHDKADMRQMHRNFEDLTDYISKDKLSFHNESIVEGGYFNGRLYGIPFETDFDVLYYRRDSRRLKNVDLTNSTWENLMDNKYVDKEKYSIAIPLKEEEEKINLFVEYFNDEIDLKNEFVRLYTENSRTLISNFVQFAVKSDSTKLTLKEAYDEYLKKNVVFFKGKASYFYSIRKQYYNTTVTLLPQNYSVLDSKYLVINKNSKIDKRTLVDIALELTSKETQLMKAKKYGSIPTFSLSVEDNVSNYKVYELFNMIKPINVKEIFIGEKSAAPYVETRMLLPQSIEGLIGMDMKHTEFSNVLENVKKVLFEKIGIKKLPFYVLNIPMVVFIVYALVFVGLVIKHRNHPHMKLFSPNFCIIIIIAIAMRIIHISNKLLVQDSNLCQYIYIYESLYTDLNLFPMVAVTYRIYKIFCNTSKFKVTRNLNRNVIIFFVVGLVVMMSYSITCSQVFLEFFFESSGRITTYRQPDCRSDGPAVWESLERRVNELIYVVMVYMVIRTGSISKRFGEFKYVYIMFLTGIMEYVRNFLIDYIPQESFYGYHILIIVVSMLVDALFIYFLVGSRIRYAMKHPEQLKKYADNTEDYATDYVTDFKKGAGQNNKGSTYVRETETRDDSSEFDFVNDCTTNYPTQLASYDSNNLLSSRTAAVSNIDYYDPNTMNYSNINNIGVNNMETIDMDINQGYSQGFSQNTTESYYYNNSNSLLIKNKNEESVHEKDKQQKNFLSTNYFSRLLKGKNGISSRNDLMSTNTVKTNMAQVDYSKSQTNNFN